jgi:hypothetical protein
MKTKQERVKGTGPRRTEIKTFAKIGTVDKELITQLYNEAVTNTENQLGTDSYGITKDVDLEGIFGVTKESLSYRQILLQTADNDVVTSEFDYTVWNKDFLNIRDELLKYFHNVYRFRISIMQPQNSINWHIDTDTSICCRAQICVAGNDAALEFKTREGIESLIMHPGEIYFINTAWPHRVVTYNDVRISSIFSFHFDDVKNKELLFK